MKMSVRVLLGLLMVGRAIATADSLVINEVMTSNTTIIADAQGDFDDWIELYNDGDQSVDAGGLYLTDNLDNPTKWRIPADQPAVTTIAPGGYLLIWVDGDDGDPGLHAGFKLDADGEELGLCAADGATPIDQLTVPALPSDTSYGRNPQALQEWQFFSRPTPGAVNEGAFAGLVADVEIGQEHGFYDEALSVTLRCDTPDVTIVYTLNGQEPDRPISSRLTAGEIYRDPITITKTTCLRAIAKRNGWKSSRMATRTFLFLEDIKTQSAGGQKPGPEWPERDTGGGGFWGGGSQMIDYGMDPAVVDDPRYRDLMDEALLALPSLSLVSDVVHLFDAQNGIYMNALQDGRDWERPASLELIHPDGTEGFQINLGLRIRGGYGRQPSNPKHAFRLFFRSEYGDARLEYPLFGDEGVDTFEKMDLRCASNYSWNYKGAFGDDNGGKNTFLRDVFSRDLQGRTGQPYTRSRYYHLYLNGQYWGIYQTQERSEARYAESYFGGDRDDYDVLKVDAGPGRPYTLEATDGNLEAYQRLWVAAQEGFASDEAYYRVQGLNVDGTPHPEYERLLDVDNLIAYMLCTFYVGDFDAPVSNFLGNQRPNNFYAIYNRVNPDGFKFFRHDAEHTMFNVQENRTGPYPAGNQVEYFNPQWLHQQLAAHEDYRARMAEKIHAYFFDDGIMTPAATAALLMARQETIDVAIIAESARWGDAKVPQPRTRDDDWLPQVEYLLNEYFPSRTDVVLQQLRAKGWYPN
jgi:hypothetical protein